ncbi:hypothetical protein RHSIM_RhsimMtG0006700 (mitochondrion) [Rhododendron simsii]|uniref:NADH:quinone oxidoreductase/Mrp antiporter transmembrane domain-containing protein n=1 Tax=Rhododendron simsii TaxID=118357 RepID=A0A834FX51_RHOSS|nr:hypothetical protein RHSIM_RhsimMtG0006700 [Rhododendron simsii]
MLHESAAFSVVLSHSCPPRRATRSVVLSHKISTPPACWPGESKFSSGQLSTQSSAKNTVKSRNARCWCASCSRGKKEERQAFAPSKTALVPFLSPFRLLLCFVPIESKAKQKCGEFKTCGALSLPSLEPRRKPHSPSDSISLLTLYMWAPDIYEGSPTPVTAFLSIAPKISISANISRVSIYGSYGATLQQIFFFCSIASMILGALAAMAQTKVKRLLAYSSIGHVGYIRTGFSCGTIEGIQSLLIGIFIYASMTIDAFAIVSALRQTRVKYIADLGALAKTNPISAITFSITMFSYAGIPPLAGFCSKFYLFFAALGCGAYFLAPVGVVTSVIGRWAAGRLPRVSQFGGPKAVLRAPDT